MAPLNYDRFFKKVFSDLEIAKSFLEDFLDIKIDGIESMNKKGKVARVTDDASIVEFDFRCEVNGQFIIIDMQQWHKQDIIHRFYLYHCLNTSLQLEDLELKKIYTDTKGVERKVKDYSLLYPAITIVWLVNESLGSQRNTITSFMQPEELDHFINGEKLWETGSIEELREKRKDILSIVNNDTKDLLFLPKNKLTFALQKNIVKNIECNKKNKKYAHWFALAEKTKNENNSEKDFTEFETQGFKETYLKIKKRICKSGLTDNEVNYITDEAENQREIQRGIDGFVNQGRKEVLEEIRRMKVKVKNQDEELENNQKELKNKDKIIAELNNKLNKEKN